MSVLIDILGGIHGLIGILWAFSLIWLTLMLTGESRESKGFSDRLQKTGLFGRITGGLAIILGIILTGVSSYYGQLSPIGSLSFYLISSGIILAIVAYVIIGEGFVMRKLKSYATEKSLVALVELETMLSLAVIILMAVGTAA
ncbi:MAG: hypothetical protein ACYDAZ_05210 [Thermoplasmataceae archaeon]